MPITFARMKLVRVFTQRCFYLFFALLLLLVTLPFLADSVRGRIAANLINLFILLAAIAAVARSNRSFILTLSLALPTVACQALGLAWDEARYLLLSWMFGAGVYVVTIVYLLRYVFRRDVMDTDRLYGAAAAYLMIGVLWVYFYAIVQHFFPGALAAGGHAGDPVPLLDLIYFSFTALTTTGFGDIVPVLAPARSLAMLEQLTGVLYVAILIARLASIYQPGERA